ncbi:MULTISPECIES: o-succinylbenzoate synthase [Brevibacillus]|jgi:o-succinylbenzoic acid (OSB) synthetase|uniref:o-succinylbenzoate synthase n=1 Tax=Brevibacillus TaxID=55080 RepID=UPI000EE477B2|nr:MULTISPECIES: o-succinylbenzoate synthase [Brevibacillus]MBU8715796.1 o-succinylbenzoate synthase [Brevibacillus parabrevis]MED2257902.1 o-succinylbenzoate synthase [Brevibacillus parabrevis]NRQ56421.1 o-succinylbenzoate synthase [Brevibacillus sp. HD1.4A]UED69526.1 o-succinylbenzoate synthase [Brevibacillus sp. HD3.3A]HBZ82137.1 o-succinylbenzoate synthase [Brevibacillus sp.]
MKIERVDLQRIKIPLTAPFVTSMGLETHKECILVRAYSGNHVGFGESVAMDVPVYNEEDVDTVWYMLEKYLIPQLFTRDIEHPDQVSEIFSWMRRNQMAKSALEGAVWDLYAKMNGLSLSQALGGTRTTIDVGVSIGIEPTIEKLLERVDGFIRDGYKKIKVKIKPGFDVEPMRAIRHTFGPDVPLMADANSAYTLADIDMLKQLDEFGLIMIEQPLGHDDIIDHATLQRELKTPICLDESIHTVEDARKAIELGSCRIINIKIGRVGGLTDAKKLHDLCAAKGVPVWCGGMQEVGIGRAHNIAIASLSNFTIPGDTSPSHRYFTEDVVTPMIDFASPGVLSVPTGAGIGFTINEAAILRSLVEHKSYYANQESTTTVIPGW